MIFFSCLQQTNAVPAYPYPITIVQPNGTILTIKINGDEFFHYKTTEDGFVIKKNKEGFYTYAVKDALGNIVPGKIIAKDKDIRTESDRIELKKVIKSSEISESTITSGIKRTEGGDTVTKLHKFPSTGSLHSLVILVNFQDNQFSVNEPLASFHSMLNQIGYDANGATGSARQYFLSCSNGKFDPQFYVVGPYTLPNNMEFYGKNLFATGNDSLPRQMVIDACNLANNAGLDFTKFDTDGDGVVDNVFIYYAGYNAAEGGSDSSIWPHRSNLGNENTVFDGKIIYNYACTSELKGNSGVNMCGIGTFAHEFSHVIGMPDYYHTTASKKPHLGEWSLMASGNYNNKGRTPPLYSAYDKFFLGWLTPEQIILTSNYELNPIEQSYSEGTKQTYLISLDKHNINHQSPNPTEFFMLEYRKKSGWDSFIPNEGMLIWHIDFDRQAWMYNVVNNYSGESQTSTDHMRVYLQPLSGSSTTPGDAFSSGTFTPTLWNNTNLNANITNITKTDEKITIRFSQLFNIISSANPSEGGTITGSGTYDAGSSCTLTATPNSGYTFVNWTDPKGAEISTSSTFSFTVTKDSTLTANFSNGNNTIPPPVFNPNVTYGTITDIDGNVYKTVTIGTQTWMAENLKVTRYNDGTAIPNVTDNAAWAGLSTGAYCWYNNDISHKATYGALYNWYAVNTGKLAPAGWHVPTDGEWTTLTTYLGESVAGDKLTETGISHWANPNAGATNETGFTALPGGHSDGFFGFIGYIGCWWSATEYDPYSVFFRSLGLGPINGIVSRGINWNKSVGYSVRCVKDDATTAPTLSTTQILGITTTTATGGGNITSDGGSAVTARGVCWNTTGSPTISDSKTSDGTGAGEFVSSLTNLAKETTYYVRAYATNSIGTAYGNEFSFNTLSESNTVTEISINISFPGTLSTSLSNEQLLTIENLKISGNIDARDFKTLRFSMPKLNKLNLKEVNISSYFGIEGTCHHENLFYPSRMIPDSTFSRRGDDFNDDFIQFSSIILPDALDSIGYASFCASEISKITIPDTDYKITIGDNAFTSCNLLNQIELLTTKIPNISRNTFSYIDKSICKLIVSPGSENAYRNAEYWKEFINIEEFKTIEEEVSTVGVNSASFIWPWVPFATSYLFTVYKDINHIQEIEHSLIYKPGPYSVNENLYRTQETDSFRLDEKSKTIKINPIKSYVSKGTWPGYEIFGLDPSTTYYYSLIAYDSYNSVLAMSNGEFRTTGIITWIEPIIYENEVSLYPNPVKKDLFVKTPSEKSTINIYSLQGSLLKTVPAYRSYEQIDVSTLQSGVYLVKISGLDGKVYAGKFVKE